MKIAFVLAMFGAVLPLLVMSTRASTSIAPIERSGLVTVPPEKQWLACHRNSQCSVTALSCHGWIAVNRWHEADVQQWYSKENADILNVVECTGPLTPKPTAICRDNICRLK